MMAAYPKYTKTNRLASAWAGAGQLTQGSGNDIYCHIEGCLFVWYEVGSTHNPCVELLPPEKGNEVQSFTTARSYLLIYKLLRE